MSILKGVKAGKYYYEEIEKKLLEQIKQWLEEHSINNKNYKIEESKDSTKESPNFTIKVDAQDVNLVGYKEESLPDYITFEAITGGSFFCSWSNIKTMRGFPKMVGQIFDISHSKIESLEHAPEIVDINYAAYGLNFTKEEIQAKTRVTRNIYC